MQKTATSAGISIQWPFCYLDYRMDKPKGVRWRRWSMAMKRLQAMEGMRDHAIFFKKRYTAAELKDRARPEALEGCTLTICGNLGPFSCARQKGPPKRSQRGKVLSLTFC